MKRNKRTKSRQNRNRQLEKSCTSRRILVFVSPHCGLARVTICRLCNFAFASLHLIASFSFACLALACTSAMLSQPLLGRTSSQDDLQTQQRNQQQQEFEADIGRLQQTSAQQSPTGQSSLPAAYQTFADDATADKLTQEAQGTMQSDEPQSQVSYELEADSTQVKNPLSASQSLAGVLASVFAISSCLVGTAWLLIFRGLPAMTPLSSRFILHPLLMLLAVVGVLTHSILVWRLSIPPVSRGKRKTAHAVLNVVALGLMGFGLAAMLESDALHNLMTAHSLRAKTGATLRCSRETAGVGDRFTRVAAASCEWLPCQDSSLPLLSDSAASSNCLRKCRIASNDFAIRITLTYCSCSCRCATKATTSERQSTAD